MVNEISAAARSRMLRELLFHQEAINKQQYELPPLLPGTHTSNTYAEMRNDPAITYALGVITEGILAEGFCVEPAENSGTGGAAMAIEIEANLKDIDTEAALEIGLGAIWRGLWPQEIKWTYQHKKFRLDQLADINPDQIALELNDQMNITGIISRPPGHAIQKLPAEKLWLHRHRPSRSKPAGESVLEPAFRSFTNKNRLLQFWGLAIQRFGTPQWMLQIPAVTSPARQGDLLSTFYAGRLDGVYLIPEDVTATLLNPTPWANLVFESAIDYCDSEMIRSILTFSTPGGQRGITHVTGSSLEVLNRATAYLLSRISRELAGSWNRQVIQPLCMANWRAQPAQCPILRLPVPDPARIAALAAPWATLATAGIADPETAADDLGLPKPTKRPDSATQTPQEEGQKP